MTIHSDSLFLEIKRTKKEKKMDSNTFLFLLLHNNIYVTYTLNAMIQSGAKQRNIHVKPKDPGTAVSNTVCYIL